MTFVRRGLQFSHTTDGAALQIDPPIPKPDDDGSEQKQAAQSHQNESCRRACHRRPLRLANCDSLPTHPIATLSNTTTISGVPSHLQGKPLELLGQQQEAFSGKQAEDQPIRREEMPAAIGVSYLGHSLASHCQEAIDDENVGGKEC